jgi:hypothetical protein
MQILLDVDNTYYRNWISLARMLSESSFRMDAMYLIDSSSAFAFDPIPGARLKGFRTPPVTDSEEHESAHLERALGRRRTFLRSLEHAGRWPLDQSSWK